MKRYLALITVVLVLSSIAAYGAVTKKPPLRVLNLCDLVDNWKKYHGHKVRVRAIYEVGAGTWLYDPTCRNGEALTYVSIQTQAKGATKRLEQIAAKDRRVWVILEGIFYGPEPFNNIDPKLPAKLREGLEKSHKRYGHLDSFDTMIRVTRVVEAAEVSDNVLTGRRLSYQMIADRIRDYAVQVELKASVHTFRHCCATHLLRGGASVRHVQQLLGHRDLNTTEIYTHIELQDLQQAIETAANRP